MKKILRNPMFYGLAVLVLVVYFFTTQSRINKVDYSVQ